MTKLLRLTGIIGLCAILLIVASYWWGKDFHSSIDPTLRVELEDYCKKHNLSRENCIIVDFSIYSGKDRLFIVDLERNEIVYSGLCAHGIGKDFDCIFKPKFSNEEGSYLSCLGHFRLGTGRKLSQYDLNAIELTGLDSTNSNAAARGIMIHDGLPNLKILGLPCLPASEGCFTVTSNTLRQITELQSKSDKPILIFSTDKSIFDFK